MSDEHIPNSDLIDDALRQAELQLEQRLEALRMSALGDVPEPESAESIHTDAILKPASASSASSASAHTDLYGQSEGETALSSAGDESSDKVWREADSNDVRFEPVSEIPSLDDEEFSHPTHLDDLAPPTPLSSEAVTEWGSEKSDYTESRLEESWANTTDGVSSSGFSDSQVSADETLEFWAQTRVALRNLQGVSDAMPDRIVNDLRSDIERIVHEEVDVTNAAIRLLQEQLANGWSKLASRVDGALENQAVGLFEHLGNLADVLPIESQKVVRELSRTLKEEIEQTSSDLQANLQYEVSQLEQSIAANVLRVAQTMGEGVVGITQDLKNLTEGLARFESEVNHGIARTEEHIAEDIRRSEQGIRDELVEPAATIQKIDEELPARFGRVERIFSEQLQGSHRDVTGVLATLVDVNRAALERTAHLSSVIDDERERRSEDTALIVDTVTTGWEGIAGAVKALYEQNDQLDKKIFAIEQRIAELNDLEAKVNGSLERLNSTMRELEPSPVVVTVAHNDAKVKNTSRSGWTPKEHKK